MIPQKCQPSIDNHCLDANTIVDGGGQIIQKTDGSISVWINDGESLIPYTDINTKPCCEFLGYIFDIENQKCLWTEPVSCDTCEKKIVINPNGSDGVFFDVNNEENTDTECSLSISFDYIFKFDCSILNSGETINTEAQNIIEQIDELTEQLNSIDCSPLSATCEDYTNIYEEMCYPIEIKIHNPISSYDDYINNEEVSTQTSTYTTICCLSENGLERWKSILGDIKFNLWLSSNGCDTTIYTTNQAIQLYNEGVELSISNNTNINPYFIETDNGICDKQLAYENKIQACKEYEDCLNLITDLEDKIEELQDQLEGLSGVLCDDPILNLERFSVTLTIDAETETPSLYETVYEEEFFNIGEGNLMQYIIDSGADTGIQITSEGEPLPNFDSNANCNFNGICKTYRDNFIKDLYLTQYLLEFGEPENSLENKELLELMGNWYNSGWLNFNTAIANQELIKLIANRKIRISLKINNCCYDFGILLDNISILKNCDKTTTTITKFVKRPKFELTKVIDNKKSWVSIEGVENREFIFDLRETSYNTSHHKLVINTKEIDLNIDPARAIENDLYNYVINNNCILDEINGVTKTITHDLNIDFESIYLSQLPTNFNPCNITVDWGIKLSVSGSIVYNEIFYSGNLQSPIPSIIQYKNAIINMVNNLGYIYEINNNYIIFINVETPFILDLSLDIELCEYKEFEDGECFTFEDGIPFIFEDDN